MTAGRKNFFILVQKLKKEVSRGICFGVRINKVAEVRLLFELF
jgi:hypothetical protein